MEESGNEMEVSESQVSESQAEEETTACDEFLRIDGLPLEQILEALLLAADEPLSIDRIVSTLGDEAPPREQIRAALKRLGSAFDVCSYELKETASGFRLQIGQPYARWVSRLREDRPPRYSRALLETLALVAYRQPITRGEIEEVRGVAVSTHIMRTLEEREWVRVVGHKDVPGKPALYATTRNFLDYFNLKSLSQLPTLEEIRDLDTAAAHLAAEAGHEGEADAGESNEADADNDNDTSMIASVQADGEEAGPILEAERADFEADSGLLEDIPTPDITH